MGLSSMKSYSLRVPEQKLWGGVLGWEGVDGGMDGVVNGDHGGGGATPAPSPGSLFGPSSLPLPLTVTIRPCCAAFLTLLIVPLWTSGRMPSENISVWMPRSLWFVSPARTALGMEPMPIWSVALGRVRVCVVGWDGGANG